MIEVITDFETASLLDLSTVGADVYAADITTEVLCLGFNEHQWRPGDNYTRSLLFDLAANPEVLWICHNAGFEKAVWREQMVKRYDFPPLPNDRWHDIMASCALRQVPLKLERALAVFGLPPKDVAASRFTQMLSKPISRGKKKGEMDRRPQSLQRVYDYNDDDIRVETALHKRIGYLPPEERRVWLLDQTINERGVRVDLPFVQAAMGIVGREQMSLVREFIGLTGGIEPTQVGQFKQWLRAQGLDLPDLQKTTIASLGITGADEDEDDGDADAPRRGISDVPENCRRALTIRSLVGSSSVAKLPRMLGCVGEDGRARGLLQYHRAGPGRWAGRLFQPQNFPRGLLGKHDHEELAASIMAGSGEGFLLADGSPANPIQTVASALRMALVPGARSIFAVGDFAGIEARLVLALAGQHDKTALMASGADVYLDMACDIYGVPKGSLTKADVEKRQIGKNTILGCGFQMGVAKFHNRYCPNQPMEFAARVIEAYRRSWAPEVPKLWENLDQCSFAAVAGWKRVETNYGIVYEPEGEFLTATLLNGKKIYYLHPRVTRMHMPWSTPQKPDIRDRWTYTAQKNGVVRRIAAYGGLLTENVVQGLACQWLIHSMFLCEEQNLPVVLTVHDENVVEPTYKGLDYAGILCDIMQTRPQWAVDIQAPVTAECWQGMRYRK